MLVDAKRAMVVFAPIVLLLVWMANRRAERTESLGFCERKR